MYDWFKWALPVYVRGPSLSLSLRPWSVDTSWPFVLERAERDTHGHPPCHAGSSRDIREETLWYPSIPESILYYNDVSWSFICVRLHDDALRLQVRQLSSADNTWGYMVPPSNHGAMSACLTSQPQPICMTNAINTPRRCPCSHVCPAQSAPITGNHRKFISVIGKEGGAEPQHSHVRQRPWGEMPSEEKTYALLV